MTDQTVQNPPQSAPASAPSEALEDQNIFDLLGISEASDDEKEVFLDELQQVIWEDFVENDVQLLLTEDEFQQFQSLSGDTSMSEDDRQAKMIEFLEKLIPDLEKIMLEKAIELKEELTRERITEYQDFYKADQAKLDKVNQALSLVDQNQWRTAALTLNSLRA
jgi:hypothetical protein